MPNRCFSSDIVESDDFMSMAVSARCLYYELGMRTDSRGYITGWRSLLLSLKASEDDIKLLLAKRFLLLRQDGRLLLQKHFNRNNKMRMDRCGETNNLSDFCKIFINENGDYTERETNIRAIDYRPSSTAKKYLETLTPGELLEYSGTKIKENKINQIKLNQNKLNESKVNKIDKTRYKHFDKCEQLVDKLISSAYITENDLELEDYYNYFDNLLEFVSTVDLKVKVDYFINQTTTLKANNGDLYRELTESTKNVSNKFLYFKTAIDRALQN